MEPVRFGVIGVGGMGGNHVRSFQDIEEAQLVAVGDVNEQAAQKVGEETGARAFTDYKDLIDNGDVQAILIATPHFFHPPVAEYAASKGVHVLSEKPVAVTVSAADKMIAACDEGGVFLGVMFQQRTDSARRAMKDLIESGALGQLHRISMTAPWYRPQAYYDSGAWRGTWKGEGGGILMNQAPHSLDQFVWLAGGSPQSVQAIADTRGHSIEVENTAMAICDFGDGKIGYFYASTAEVPGGERVEIAGDKGLLTLDDQGLRFYELETPLTEHLTTSKENFGRPKGAWRTIEHEGKGQSHVTVTRAFCRAIQNQDASLMVADGREGLKALELANAILTAGYTRREVPMPLDRATFDAMLEKLQNGAKPSELRA
ncbi:MAG: Gfo/Idh/MocA family oxidoreductase [Armatimonadetes bacterium]|nr:Gfo/Idh/MocA family oxidoreductase [Armatimonadota bacterium]